MRNVTKKILLWTIGCSIIFGVLLYNINKKSTRIIWISGTTNFSDINILAYTKPRTSYELSYPSVSVTERIAGDRNIFFLETSHIRNRNEIILNPRQGCAVESAARMNPTMKVYLFIFNTNQSMNYSNETKNVLAQLMSYNNIAIRHVSLATYFENSPMDKWWNSTRGPNSSQWFTSHMSDVLRYLTLWKFGGIYLDLDVVIKKSLVHLTNFVCVEDHFKVAAGAIGFDVMDIGRGLANACLHEIITNFRGDDWSYNGPGVITRTLNKICDTIFTIRMSTDRCEGFTVLPSSAFYPIYYSNWRQYFNIEYKKSTMKAIDNALAIHVWNKFSHSTIVKVGSAVPYAEIANKYCPRIYNNCGDVF